MTPRCEIAPVTVAMYLLSEVPFALLISVDLLPQVRKPNLYLNSPHEQLAFHYQLGEMLQRHRSPTNTSMYAVLVW
jgi:hypothetical protein